MITENIVATHAFSWIDVERPMRTDFRFIEEEFNLSPLLVLDCMRPEHLPKYEKTQNGHFFMVRFYDPVQGVGEGDITVQRLTNKLAIFISDSKVVTIHYEKLYPLRKFAELRKSPGFPQDSRSLTHQLLRISNISFEDALDKLKLDYEVFEKEILSQKTERLSSKRIYEFRRRFYVVKGMLQMTQSLVKNSRDFWKEDISLQQDIRENIDQLYFKMEALSHDFDQLFDLNISINEQRNNEVMKILTVFASIMLPLTFISSFFGMNFNNLPGMHSTTGFVGVVVLMVTTTFITIWFFNKKRWFKSSL